MPVLALLSVAGFWVTRERRAVGRNMSGFLSLEAQPAAIERQPLRTGQPFTPRNLVLLPIANCSELRFHLVLNVAASARHWGAYVRTILSRKTRCSGRSRYLRHIDLGCSLLTSLLSSESESPSIKSVTLVSSSKVGTRRQLPVNRAM